MLIVDALALVAGSAFSDRIVGAVVIVPALLVGVIVAIACLSADLVQTAQADRVDLLGAHDRRAVSVPRARVSARAAGWRRPRSIVLQVIPLVAAGSAARPAGAVPRPRRVLAALVITTALLLVLVGVLVWYGTPTCSAAGGALHPRPVPDAGHDDRGRLRVAAEGGPRAGRPARARAATARLGRRRRPASPASARDTRYRVDRQHRRTVGRGRRVHDGAALDRRADHARLVRRLRVGERARVRSRPARGGRRSARSFLSAGDNAYLLAAPPFLNRAIFDPLHALLGEAPMVAALGEHDLAYRDGAAVISALHLPGHQYTVQYGPVQVVVLGLEADASALRYASKTLGNCRAPCPVRFVLTHRPISADNPIMPLLRRRHVAAILAGHLHRYERHVRAGVLEFTIGTGGEGPRRRGQHPGRHPTRSVSFLAYGFLRIGIDRRADQLPVHRRAGPGAGRGKPDGDPIVEVVEAILMQLIRNGGETTPGPAEWFTGVVHIDPIAAVGDASRIGAASVHFTPGARTAWHTHPHGQTIWVTEGVACASAAEVTSRSSAQETAVFFEPGEDHWHGAASTRFMSHVAMQQADGDGNVVTWGDHVTDAEYALAPPG